MAVAASLGRWFPANGPHIDVAVKAISTILFKGSMFALGMAANVLSGIKKGVMMVLRRDPDRPPKKVNPRATPAQSRVSPRTQAVG